MAGQTSHPAFLGVELLAGNGYLLHAFLAAGSNRRDDEYGGSPSHRIRFVLDTAEAVTERIGMDRLGVRISPGVAYNDMHEPDAEATYALLLDGLAEQGIGSRRVIVEPSAVDHDIVAQTRGPWPRTLLDKVAMEELFTPDRAEDLLREAWIS